MAIDIIGEVIGGIVEVIIEILANRARGCKLFFLIITFFVVIPLLIFGLYHLFT